MNHFCQPQRESSEEIHRLIEKYALLSVFFTCQEEQLIFELATFTVRELEDYFMSMLAPLESWRQVWQDIKYWLLAACCLITLLASLDKYLVKR